MEFIYFMTHKNELINYEPYNMDHIIWLILYCFTRNHLGFQILMASLLVDLTSISCCKILFLIINI